MVINPPCKINLGLYVTERRADGMHNLSTVFLPVNLCDTLEVCPLDNTYTEDILHLTGTKLQGAEGGDNLVIRTIKSLRKDYPQIPFMEVWLHKRIPTGAGLGGGSSDAAFTMRLVNEICHLELSDEEAIERLSHLGADCAFFWHATPVYAEGIGEEMHPIVLPQLQGFYIVLIKPDYGVSTREAFSGITPQTPKIELREALTHNINLWRNEIGNDFENTVFPIYPELKAIKDTLYDLGATYAQMSGSGSTMLGLFPHRPTEDLSKIFKNHFIHISQLTL